MNPTTAENIAKLFTYYSTWVAALASFVAGYWLQLAPEEQAQILAQWPMLKHYAPIFAFLAFAAARVKAQGVPTPNFTPPPAGTGNTGEVIGHAGDEFQATVPVAGLSAEQAYTVMEAAKIIRAYQAGRSAP